MRQREDYPEVAVLAKLNCRTVVGGCRETAKERLVRAGTQINGWVPKTEAADARKPAWQVVTGERN